ncbi:hypothetical protein [Beijerinckia sp. L45]|uniref:hypothetical protein n=1 Tax=Beijerinckia sp. L45 TaxID=1641855 RepID=UPI00131D6140|nr:hypothetical protein [Beijerinckia sp. L45]
MTYSDAPKVVGSAASHSESEVIAAARLILADRDVSDHEIYQARTALSRIRAKRYQAEIAEKGGDVAVP